MMEQVDFLAERIRSLAYGLGAVRIMEVCGTHTHNIWRYGLRQLLPENVHLISGPGCPVCVTSQRDISLALAAAEKKNVTLCCFGDLMRVPCGSTSLLSLRESGADVRIATSPMDALRIAESNPDREVVWFGVGFETTAPHTAALAEAVLADRIPNLSILSVHKTMPEAIRALMKNGSRVDGLLCPGHVAVITGADAFRFIPDELGMPAAISGFEAEDILAAILLLLSMLRSGKPDCLNAYPRAVQSSGNRTALELLNRVFEPCTAEWRGLGPIPQSGLRLCGEFLKLDAGKRLSLIPRDTPEPPGCICGGVLRGQKDPRECPNFGTGCTPDTPLGACMVSSEGSCAASYKYGGL